MQWSQGVGAWAPGALVLAGGLRWSSADSWAALELNQGGNLFPLVNRTQLVIIGARVKHSIPREACSTRGPN